VRVLFHPQVLNDPHRYGSHIEAIVERFYSGQHQWVIEDLDVVLRSAWMKDRAKWSTHDTFAEKIYRESIDQPSTSEPRRFLVIDLDETAGPGAPSNSVRVLPSRARQILGEPLFLIVENAESDGAFVRATSELYAADLWLALENLWLKAEHAGGKGEFAKRADELLASGVPPWRIAVLMDSDRLVPGLLPTANAKIQEKLEERGIRVFPLFKREAENYLPPSLLGKGLKVKVFLGLSPVQRDHFDMKKGFTKERNGTVVIPYQQQKLYEDLSEWQLEQLAGGFGKSIGDRFKDARLSSEEMSFVCQTHPEELEHLLTSLQEML
jgi:hypothetical protein